MTLSAEQIQKLEELLAKPTPGEWISLDHGPDEWRPGPTFGVRQKDTDPTNKHHWPTRICQSVTGVFPAEKSFDGDLIAAMKNALPALLREAKAGGWRVPDGWQLVPKVATDLMMRAGARTWLVTKRWEPSRIYEAMIAAVRNATGTALSQTAHAKRARALVKWQRPPLHPLPPRERRKAIMGETSASDAIILSVRLKSGQFESSVVMPIPATKEQVDSAVMNWLQLVATGLRISASHMNVTLPVSPTPTMQD